MWLVLTALRRPVTVLVAVLAIALCSVLALRRMSVDIFPKLGAPQICAAQAYGGTDPAQMEGFLTYYYEYHFLSRESSPSGTSIPARWWDPPRLPCCASSRSRHCGW